MKVGVFARRVADGRIEIVFRGLPLELMALVARWDDMSEQTKQALEQSLKRLGHGVVSGGTN